MSRTAKLVKSFLSNPPEASFSDVEYLLRAFEFEEVRSSGSHHIFRHKDGRMQIVPKKHGQKVKGAYIKQIVKLLRLEEWYDQEED